MDKKLKDVSEQLKATLGESYAKAFEEANKEKIKPLSEQAKIVQEIKSRKANRLLADRRMAVSALSSTVNYLNNKK